MQPFAKAKSHRCGIDRTQGSVAITNPGYFQTRRDIVGPFAQVFLDFPFFAHSKAHSDTQCSIFERGFCPQCDRNRTRSIRPAGAVATSPADHTRWVAPVFTARAQKLVRRRTACFCRLSGLRLRQSSCRPPLSIKTRRPERRCSRTGPLHQIQHRSPSF